MVKAKDFTMWNMSPSMLFGKSPKIDFLCGSCGCHSSGRLSLMAVQRKKPYLPCSYCGEINIIPVVLS